MGSCAASAVGHRVPGTSMTDETAHRGLSRGAYPKYFQHYLWRQFMTMAIKGAAPGASIGEAPLLLLLKLRAFIALFAVAIFFSFAAHNFLSIENLLIMSRHVALNAFLAIGMTFVIVAGRHRPLRRIDRRSVGHGRGRPDSARHSASACNTRCYLSVPEVIVRRAADGRAPSARSTGC